MKQIYMIAENVLTIENGEEVTETRVCHNFGAFTKDDVAKLYCVGLNATAMGEDDNPETWEDIYFVLPIDVKV